MSERKNIPVHPAAEAYRLMTEEELTNLAADMMLHGQRDPIVLGRVNGAASEKLVDGRNRLRACEIAGIEPKFETLQFENDDEIKAFVKSRGERRNISKGEQAMAVAWLYPEPEKGGRGNKGKAAETADFSQRRLREARAVYRHSPELAKAVRDGIIPLDKALKDVEAARRELESTEAQLKRLRGMAPDLADLVEEERMKLDEATKVLESRIGNQQRVERTATELLSRLVDMVHPRTNSPEFYAAALTKDVNPKYWPPDGLAFTQANLNAAAQVFAAIAKLGPKWLETKDE